MVNPGAGESDQLQGNAGADTFVLGDTNNSFYVAHGAKDKALITDFEFAQDVIQLHGSADNYKLVELSSKTQIFSGKNGLPQDELVAEIKGDFSGLNLSGANFQYV